MTVQPRCPNDQTEMLPAKLRQVKLTLQLQTAGYFTGGGHELQLFTCPVCGLTQGYARPPLTPEPR
ncbi:hypothetical protein [Deinococcus aquiradiocola]|uniref:Uncharacterized protein n=1 Tax=Deinococcus aquiradiocola TaxID=393059 RepID=A0A917UMM1_9DEIO|nr:hypothetical protein [Deinococcus aquiradiocola]GGJ68426.1 hypothetical protein GCM10008939_11050 [Deinococcus aquiradiocola]